MNNDPVMMPKRAMYWNEDAGGWYDLETDVAVKNMGPPEAEWIAAMRFASGGSEDTATPTDAIDAVNNLRREIVAHVSKEYTDLVMNHIVPLAHKIPDVTQLENRVTALQQRIAVLERPWWKRWLNR